MSIYRGSVGDIQFIIELRLTNTPGEPESFAKDKKTRRNKLTQGKRLNHKKKPPFSSWCLIVDCMSKKA
eukprot:1480310-Prorocentrum_lima.AAC.1